MYVGLFVGVEGAARGVLSIVVLRLKQQTLRRPNIPVELAGPRQWMSSQRRGGTCTPLGSPLDCRWTAVRFPLRLSPGGSVEGAR